MTMPDVRCGEVVVSGAHFIGGERVSSSETMDVHSPIDGSRLGAVCAAGPRDVDLAVDAAARAFPAWAALGRGGRGAVLRRFADLIERDVERLARVETLALSPADGRQFRRSLRKRFLIPSDTRSEVSHQDPSAKESPASRLPKGPR